MLKTDFVANSGVESVEWLRVFICHQRAVTVDFETKVSLPKPQIESHTVNIVSKAVESCITLWTFTRLLTEYQRPESRSRFRSH